MCVGGVGWTGILGGAVWIRGQASMSGFPGRITEPLERTHCHSRVLETCLYPDSHINCCVTLEKSLLCTPVVYLYKMRGPCGISRSHCHCLSNEHFLQVTSQVEAQWRPVLVAQPSHNCPGSSSKMARSGTRPGRFFKGTPLGGSLGREWFTHWRTTL